MARYIKHTDLPLDEAWPVQIRAPQWDAQESPWVQWTIRAGLPRANPMHGGGQYEIEYCYLQTSDRKLVDAVLGQLVTAPSKSDPGGHSYYEITIIRSKEGQRNLWKTYDGYQRPASAAGSPAGPKQQTSAGSGSEQAKRAYGIFCMIYEHMTEDLYGGPVSERDTILMRSAIINASSRLAAAVIKATA